MKILVLGASGGVGSHLVDEARRRGHEVSEGTRQTVDATDAGSIARAATGHDAVLNAVINRADPGMIVDVAHALLAALPQAGDPRLLIVGGAGTLEVEPGRLVLDLDDFNPDYRTEGQAHLDVLDLLRTADTPVEWTIVTPPRSFADTGRTGVYRTTGDAILYDADHRNGISLEDFAVAVLDEAEHRRHPRQRFSVAY